MKIATAAVTLSNGLIVSLPRPARHHDIINELARANIICLEQGFLTDEGNFVTRSEGWHIAQDAGQIVYECGGPYGVLYSDNLWKKTGYYNLS